MTWTIIQQCLSVAYSYVVNYKIIGCKTDHPVKLAIADLSFKKWYYPHILSPDILNQATAS